MFVFSDNTADVLPPGIAMETNAPIVWRISYSISATTSQGNMIIFSMWWLEVKYTWAKKPDSISSV